MFGYAEFRSYLSDVLVLDGIRLYHVWRVVRIGIGLLGGYRIGNRWRCIGLSCNFWRCRILNKHSNTYPILNPSSHHRHLHKHNNHPPKNTMPLFHHNHPRRLHPITNHQQSRNPPLNQRNRQQTSNNHKPYRLMIQRLPYH